MANEIVKYKNDISELPLEGFTASEINILMTLFYLCKDKETEVIRINYDYLEGLSQFQGKSRKRFLEELHNTARKLRLLSIDQTKDDGGFIIFNFFQTFESFDTYLEISVNKDFTYLLNRFELGNYTSFELAEINSLKSTYSKNMYRLLSRYSDTGWMKIKMDSFRRKLVVPDSYKTGDITKRVLEPIKKELPQYFEDLKIEELKERGKGKVITGYYFKWTPRKRRLQFEPGKHKERYAKKLALNCPRCGEPLYELENKRGFLFIGHIDGWKEEAKCKETFGAVTDVLGLKEDPSPSNPQSYKNNEEELTAEQKENIKKINEITENLFK